MKNWKAIAQATGLDLSGAGLERITRPLESLEDTFRPLVRDLSPDIEPSFCFRAGDGE